MTMQASKDLEFPIVALPSVGRMPVKGEEQQEAARAFYVATMRTTQRLLIELSGGLAIALTAVGSKSKWTDPLPFAIQRQLSKFIDHSSLRT
jgi:superfamily I DNA/RNA helicase